MRRDLDARPRGPGYVREPDLEIPRGHGNRRVRSRSQPDGGDLPARVAVGRGPAAQGRRGGGHGLSATGANQRRRRDGRDARVVVSEGHGAERGADGVARRGRPATRRNRKASQVYGEAPAASVIFRETKVLPRELVGVLPRRPPASIINRWMSSVWLSTACYAVAVRFRLIRGGDRGWTGT